MPWRKIVRKPDHSCSPPGRRERHSVDAIEGSQWECPLCTAVWTYKRVQGVHGGAVYPHWVKETPRPDPPRRPGADVVYRGGKQPPMPPPPPRSVSEPPKPPPTALLGSIDVALDIASEYGGIDGAHHKAWVIDQMVRALTGDQYKEFVAHYEGGEDGPDTYLWDEGVTP